MNPVSTRGEATIITCGLNRSQLIALRAKTAASVIAELKNLKRANDEESTGRHLLALRALCASDAQFAGMNRWWVWWMIGWTWEELNASTR
jgi:hypothetical protein